MMITKKNIKKHEIIGLEVEVLKSKNKSQEKMKGLVVDETKKTIKVDTKKEEKTIPKQDTVFMFKKNKKVIKVNGNDIMFRPEERIRKC